MTPDEGILVSDRTLRLMAELHPTNNTLVSSNKAALVNPMSQEKEKYNDCGGSGGEY